MRLSVGSKQIPQATRGPCPPWGDSPLRLACPLDRTRLHSLRRVLLLCACACLWLGGCAAGDTSRPPPTAALPSVTVSTPVRPTSTPLPTKEASRPLPTPTRTKTPAPTPTRTPTPSPVPSPTAAARRAVLAFVSDWTGDDDVYLLDLGSGALTNLTHAPGEDRDPAFAPGGRSLVFRSNARGTWALERIDLVTGNRTPLPAEGEGATADKGAISWSLLGDHAYVYASYGDGNLDLYIGDSKGGRQPLTRNRAGDYAPAWRPGAAQIAFTSWRGGDKDLYIIEADGGDLAPLVSGPTDDETPAWHPEGQRLAFVRWQDHDADLYELELASGAIAPLVTDPYPDRSPTYAPDGTLFWTRYVPGQAFEVHDPFAPGRWQLWRRDPEGREQPVPLPIAQMDVYAPAAGTAPWPEGEWSPRPASTPGSLRAPGELAGLIELDIECAGNNPKMHADLAGAYAAWRAEVEAQSGYDVMGKVSDMFRPLGYSRREYGHLSWHRTGRTVDLLFEWHDPPDGPDRMLVAREDLGAQTYWRLYIRAREQDGTMGEPLADAPWVFWFNLDPAQEPEAYAAGGRPGPIPAGYYVDLTRIAGRHGWHRIASYETADFDWRTDSVGREFWHYQRADGRTWWEAMREIYSLEELEQTYSWTICTDELGMDPTWLEAKGIPTSTPQVSP